MTRRILPWLRACAATAEVIVADPGRAYVPDTGRAELARMTVPTSLELEDGASRTVVLFRLEEEPAAAGAVRFDRRSEAQA